MSNSTVRPLDPELLSFLHSLVNEGSGQQQERTDSDKENEAGLNTIVEEDPSVAEQERAVEVKMQQAPGEDGRGVNTRDDPSNEKLWDEFYNEEDFQKKETKPKESEEEYDYSDEKFETLDKVEEEEGEDSSRRDGSDGASKKQPAKKRKKRLFKRVIRPRPLSSSAPTATGGSHPDLGRHDSDGDRHSNQLETMSETSAGRSGRRLSRRKQVARPRCAGPTPTGDVLQQKYQELQTLLVTPLTEPGQRVQQTRQELRRLMNMTQQQAAQTVHALPPTGPGREIHRRQVFSELNEENTEHGYATIRTVQVSNQVTVHRPQTAHHRQRAAPRQPQRPFSAGNQRDNRDQAGRGGGCNKSSSANGVRGRGRGNEKGRNERSDRSNSGSVRNSARSDNSKSSGTDTDDDEKNRSGSQSPGRIVQYLDTHLENSNNPALRQWLQKKKKEMRKQKAEERKKKREERHKKQEEERKKQEYFKDSDKKVREWMKQKRKEAFKKAVEDRRRYREEEKERYEREHKQQDLIAYAAFRPGSTERPASAQNHQGRKMFIPVIRPETANGGEQATEQSSETIKPQPPPTKFVYKRPVSGRVRLMKLQQQQKEDAKRTELEQKLFEKKLAEEKAKKMRMSYDQWLLKKREEDYTKRQEAARQKALAKSDPELERIVPEVARRRIENIQRGKKRISTGIRKINEDVNKSFGGGDFGTESEGEDAKGIHRLQVSGSQQSLKQRPSSAKPALNPRMSKSPRRPKSANPRVQALLDADKNGSASEAPAFKLPFPPEKGAPKHVAAKQKKLFSPNVFQEGASNSQQSEDTAKASDSMIESTSQEEEGKTTEESTEQNPAEGKSDVNPEYADYEEPGKSFFVTNGNVEESSQKETTEEADKVDEEMQEETPEEQQTEVSEEVIEDKSCEETVEATEIVDLFGSGEGQNGQETKEESHSEEQAVEQGEEIQQGEETVEQGEEIQQGEETVEQGQESNQGEQTEEQGQEIDGSVAEEVKATEDKTVEDNNEDLTLKLHNDEEELEVDFEYNEEVHEDVVEKLEGDRSELSESKSSVKHVSFQEEAVVFEPPDDPIQSVDFDEDDDDEAEDERGGYFGNETPRSDDGF